MTMPAWTVKSLVGVVCALCALPACLAQQGFTWKVQEYPDPFSYNSFSQCGRSDQSNICDPNGLIPREEADKLDTLIQSVYSETRCSCSDCIRNSHGYVIRVALMPRMASILNLGNETEDKLLDAQMFSYILTRNWAMGGSCNESLLILYSRYDGILYTLTLKDARSRLDDDTVKQITMKVRPLFDNEETIGEGLKEMIQLYKLVLDNQRDEAMRPKIAQQRGNSATSLSSTLLTPLVVASFISLHH